MKNFLIFVEVRDLQVELARPAVFLFSYFCEDRQSSNGARILAKIIVDSARAFKLAHVVL